MKYQPPMKTEETVFMNYNRSFTFYSIQTPSEKKENEFYAFMSGVSHVTVNWS